MVSRSEDLKETKKMIMKIATISNYEWEKIEREEKDRRHIDKRTELLSIMFLPFNDGHVKNIIALNEFKTHIKENKKYKVFLPPIEKTDCLPLLTFNWNHDGCKWEWGFILDIVKNYSSILSLRFETKHSDGETHSHLHMQINNKIFGPPICEDSYQLKWLPGEQPHLLIRSDNFSTSPVILLIYLLGSLYGFKEVGKFLGDTHPRYLLDMKDYFS